LETSPEQSPIIILIRSCHTIQHKSLVPRVERHSVQTPDVFQKCTEMEKNDEAVNLGVIVATYNIVELKVLKLTSTLPL
jgi:hypothetical protein